MKTKEKIAITIDVNLFKELTRLRETQAVNISGFINNAVAAALRVKEAPCEK